MTTSRMNRFQLIRQACDITTKTSDILGYEGMGGRCEMEVSDAAIDRCGREDFKSHSLPESVLLHMDANELNQYVNQGNGLLRSYEQYMIPPRILPTRKSLEKFFIGYTLFGILVCGPLAIIVNATNTSTPTGYTPTELQAQYDQQFNN